MKKLFLSLVNVLLELCKFIWEIRYIVLLWVTLLFPPASIIEAISNLFAIAVFFGLDLQKIADKKPEDPITINYTEFSYPQESEYTEPIIPPWEESE